MTPASAGWCWERAGRSASAARSSCSPYRDGTLLGHVVGVARACSFDQLVVAIGGAADDVRARVDLSGADVVVNDAYGEGCSSSIAAALRVVDERCDLLVLMLGDQPGVTAETVSALLAGRGDARSRCAATTTVAGTRSRSTEACSVRSPTCTATRACWRLPTRRATTWSRSRWPGPIPRDVDTLEDYAAIR